MDRSTGARNAAPRLASRLASPRAMKITALSVVSFAALAVFMVMQPWHVFSANTPTGGDMGAHVYVPAYLRDTLLPQGRIMGWSNGWYAGFPILYFYFPLPALTIVALDVLIPYGVAFKLVTIAGLVGLPFAGYFLGRCLRYPRAVAAVAAVAGSTFVYTESHTIFGGNIAATLAGEYSFSWSLALSLVYFGLVIKASREGKGFTPAAAVVLALTALSHLITTAIIVVASLPLLLRKRGAAPVTGSWGVGFALSAFWALPLLARVRDFTADMNWSPVPYIRMVDGVEVNNVFPREMIVLIVLGVVGAGWALLRRYDVGPMIWLGAIAAAGFFVIDWIEFTKLYNARLLPYWYYTVFFLAGTAGGLFVVEIARRVPRRRATLVAGTALASVFFLVAGLVSLSFAAGWARWNYTGYEGKGAWPEYEGLLQRVSELPPGRVMWEANREMDKYGTPMALMLLPYWTNESHPSMEGLLFESSLTTPFHFLNAAEVSERPSNPVRGLNYRTRDFDRALEHLPLYNVEYYVAFTDESKAKADAVLERLFESPPWVVYRLPDSSLVDVATTVPAVYEGGDFLEASLNWYDRVGRLDQWLVADGPDEWPRVDDPEQPFPVTSTPVTTAGTVSNIVLEDHRIAFSTTAIGVPHLVKVSHFPNWTARGALGPYRAAPSLMVVIPTEADVELTFDYTAPELAGFALTGGSIVGVVGWAVWRRRRERIPTGVPGAPPSG